VDLTLKQAPHMSSTVQLHSWWSLSDALRRQVLGLQIDPVQIEYAGTIERAILSLGETEDENMAGLAILRSGEGVGFVVLKRGDKAPAWAAPGWAVVSAMRVDRRQQGGGVGSQALVALSPWLRQHWPECHTLALAVDEENARGIKAYTRAGFADAGQREQGRIGWVRYMHKPVSAQGSHEVSQVTPRC
jgi:RimJ/RimL family protein N-acetyltransferase